MFDLDAYFARIGLADRPVADRESLEALHLGHLAAIPFENIDVRLRRPIRLDLESLQAKLIVSRRGGYCFEQNTVFAAALRAFGFAVDTLEARVRPREADGVLPRTHMALRVRFADGDFLADVGFGASGPLLPVPLDGTVSTQPDGDYVVREEAPGAFALQRHVEGAWLDQYGFGLEPALPVDFEVANHFTSTFPASPFVNTLTAQRSLASGRHILRGRSYTARTGTREVAREIAPAELPELLRGAFGLDVTDEEARRALGQE